MRGMQNVGRRMKGAYGRRARGRHGRPSWASQSGMPCELRQSGALPATRAFCRHFSTSWIAIRIECRSLARVPRSAAPSSWAYDDCARVGCAWTSLSRAVCIALRQGWSELVAYLFDCLKRLQCSASASAKSGATVATQLKVDVGRRPVGVEKLNLILNVILTLYA